MHQTAQKWVGVVFKIHVLLTTILDEGEWPDTGSDRFASGKKSVSFPSIHWPPEVV
jgi:hypothetical protein